MAWLCRPDAKYEYFFAYIHACERSPAREQRPVVAPEATAASTLNAPSTHSAEPRYTFVGPAQLVEVADPSREENISFGSRATKTRKSDAVATDTLLTLDRQAQTTVAPGTIPDLDIRLGSVDLQQVMQEYGYVPAIKTRSRLIGKIVDAQFVPLTAAEISRYARRGRSGAQHPMAEHWLRRVATALRLPLEELQFIFLVPHATEQIFIATELVHRFIKTFTITF